MQTTSGLRAAINHYAQHHRTPANRALHFVGIPTIAIGLLGLLSKLSLDIGTAPALRPNAAWLALLGTGWWYFRSGGLLGLATFAAILLCYAAGSLLPGDALAWLLAAGVAAHLVGHFGFEKKPPTVFSRPLAALAAPAWLLLTLAGREPGEQVVIADEWGRRDMLINPHWTHDWLNHILGLGAYPISTGATGDGDP